MNTRINVKFEPEQFAQIVAIANKRNVPYSEVVREWSLQGLNGTLNTDNISFITYILREQLADVMRPQLDRLATLNAKTCIQSGTAAYLSAEAILKFVPLAQRIEVEESYALARKKAVAFLKHDISLTE